jgi:hypothetical protein
VKWTPSRRALMLHVLKLGSWLDCDPIRVSPCTVRDLERLGFLVVERVEGRPVSAVGTCEGIDAFIRYWEGEAA